MDIYYDQSSIIMFVDFSVGMNLLGGEGVMSFGYDLLSNKSGQITQVSFAFSNKNIIDWP